MVILGIDPGETLIGIGAVKKDGSKLKLLGYECIEIKNSKKKSAPEKLKEVSEKINNIIKKYNPNLVAVEDIFFFKNLKTAIKVAQTRGVLLLECQKSNLKIIEFTPLQVKQSVACYGRADKKQVQSMVKSILGLKDTPKPDDAADAVAIAICAANTNIELLKK